MVFKLEHPAAVTGVMISVMAKPFLFCCPMTGQNVQALPEFNDEPSDGRRLYQGVLCSACQRVHIVNPLSGRLMSEEFERVSHFPKDQT